MFIKRAISAVTLVGLTIIAALTGGFVVWLLVGVFGICAAYELYKANGYLNSEEGKSTLCYVGLFMGVPMYVLSAMVDYKLSIIACSFLYLVILLAVYVFTFNKYKIADIAFMLFGFIYTIVALQFIAIIRECFDNGVYLVWLALIPPIASDTFAYCVGMLIGKHKMAPVVSPKKSIEGSVGGIIGAGLVTGIYGYFVSTKISVGGGFVFACVILGIVCGGISQVGDLAASAIKREKGIKDYGNVIPGHGGFLDRIDSIIYISPIVYVGVVLLDMFFL